jgi:cytochrome b561
MQAITKYPLTIRWLHRIIALLIIFMIALGWYVSTLDYEDINYQFLRQLHRTVGLALFPLGIAQIVAYTTLPRPALAPTLKTWERRLAKLTHMFLLYVVIAIPVAGYLMSGEQLIVLGDYKIPVFPQLSKGIRSTLFDVHEMFAWATAALATLHAVAALKHHFIDKDDTLKKML